jgi:hypothetical protein
VNIERLQLFVLCSPAQHRYALLRARYLTDPLLAGLAGPVNIDANGDRIADYSLLDMDPLTSTFHVSTR